MNTLDPLPPHLGPLRPNSLYEALAQREPGHWKAKDRCKTCGGKKTFIRYDHGTRQSAEWACDCLSQWLLYLNLLHAGIRLNYQRACWNDIDSQVPSSVLDKVLDYFAHADRCVQVGRGLILRGQHGTGKTLLATLLAKRLIELGYGAFFVSFHELLDSYTGGWKNEAARDRFRWYLSADFLVIDEVSATRNVGGMEHVAESMFDHLVRVRTGDDKPTIITTNMTEADLHHFGSGVISLLAETSEFVEVTGGDFRPRVKERERIEWENGASRPVVLG